MDTCTYSNRTLLPIAVSILSTFSFSVAFGLDDIDGVIRGPEGGEAGVWVIAEARDHAEASRIAAEAASLFGRA